MQYGKEGDGVYLFVIEGEVTVDGQKLNKRDGLGITEAQAVKIAADSNAEVLLIEVPMLKAAY
jgi:redox-sensitive bicupin YhaK (pirin superfamily)